MNSCVGCSTELPEMANFCPTCGINQSQISPELSSDATNPCMHPLRFRQKSGGMYCPTCPGYIDESTGGILNLWESRDNETEPENTDIFATLFGGTHSNSKSSGVAASDLRTFEQKLELAGNQIWKKIVLGRKMAIFENAYISISPVLFFPEEAPEKLISISVEYNSQKKSPIGRGAAALATGGANLLLARNRKGDLFLTICTDVQVHVFHEPAPSPGQIKSCLELEATVNRVLSNV